METSDAQNILADSLAALVGRLRIREVGNGGQSRREMRRERAGRRLGSLR